MFHSAPLCQNTRTLPFVSIGVTGLKYLLLIVDSVFLLIKIVNHQQMPTVLCY